MYDIDERHPAAVGVCAVVFVVTVVASAYNTYCEMEVAVMHKGKEKIVTASLIAEKHLWLMLIPICAIFSFISWEIGQGVGADLGRFIFNLKH